MARHALARPSLPEDDKLLAELVAQGMTPILLKLLGKATNRPGNRNMRLFTVAIKHMTVRAKDASLAARNQARPKLRLQLADATKASSAEA